MEASVRVVRHHGSVAELHALEPFSSDPSLTDQNAVPVVWWCQPTDAAIVLGSRQSEEVLDLDAVRRADLGVVHRRSGGGAVVVGPDVVWIDLVVPAGIGPIGAVMGDVRRSMVWAGERWRDALVEVGVPRDRLAVHTAGLVENAWSSLVCFAGSGPGEVFLDGRKLVGLSQRRTRLGTRIQGQLHRSGSLAAMPALFAPPTPDAALGDAAEWPPVVAADLVDALARSVGRIDVL